MSDDWPNLQVLELFVAVVDTGSVGAGARKSGMAQPNASRAVAELETRLKTSLLERSPRGSVPTEAGLALADHARELLDAAQSFTGWLRSSPTGGREDIRVGASMTIAETLLPAWLAEVRRRRPTLRVDVHVLNSSQVLHEVQQGALHVGFVETPNVPVRVNAMVVQEDQLLVVVPPNHRWAHHTGKISLAELARTPLVVREPGSGTCEALQELFAGLPMAEPAQVLGSNAAVRVAVLSGAGPAALSALALHEQLESGALLRVPFEGQGISRPLTAVWSGAQRLFGAAADLVAVAAAQEGPH
ncbi:LysR family transcriptional regulator [Arthrobacter psychrochitiniphilus]|uniref:LysR family transcriptional regulator n=1 Tax=Arthrobacter psychrochitiniphilus TaxID=291045 RepID=A0A2V3E2G6_9MICC|nr:LysR family transcriptional regulator [Arthrobacter psychrochitiniphilus]NYG16436.1 DNA-binding transcriptional LysR family regulator [Arthrobacter psychrochitiniphilus]PXA69414.1 LysR family transcriptional regulator [Arthrobacter psychrochitiniphilus]